MLDLMKPVVSAGHLGSARRDAGRVRRFWAWCGDKFGGRRRQPIPGRLHGIEPLLIDKLRFSLSCLDRRMTALDFTQLTRRADPDRADCWRIYRGDVCAGWIARSVGRPNAQNEWTWSAGFYPGSGPGEIKIGTADTFAEARAKFERAWLAFASSRTPEDFEEWREQRDWTARKYAARDRGEQVPVR